MKESLHHDISSPLKDAEQQEEATPDQELNIFNMKTEKPAENAGL